MHFLKMRLAFLSSEVRDHMCMHMQFLPAAAACTGACVWPIHIISCRLQSLTVLHLLLGGQRTLDRIFTLHCKD